MVGKCPFHARLCQSYDSWEENSGDAMILSFSMQFWQICVDWDFPLDAAVWKITLIAMKGNGKVSILCGRF